MPLQQVAGVTHCRSHDGGRPEFAREEQRFSENPVKKVRTPLLSVIYLRFTSTQIAISFGKHLHGNCSK